MKGKLIGLGVSILLVTAVAIGLVLGIKNIDKPKPPPAKDPLSSTSKAVAAFCRPTDFKETCVQSLNSIANNQSATPTDYIHVAINSTIEAMVEAIAKSDFVAKGANDSLNKMAFQDCKELFNFAIDELQEVLNHVNMTDLDDISGQVANLKNWLSATIAYQESCVDGIMGRDDLKNQMSTGLETASQMTSNLLAFVSEIVPILNNFGVEANVSNKNTNDLSTPPRQLVDTTRDGYPNWVSSRDRKLLRRIHVNNPKPDAIVAQDGSGQFKTISAAVAAYPKNLKGRYVIYVKAGKYKENVLITKDQVNIFMYGDGPRRTIVTGSKSFRDGITTMKTATFAVVGKNFICNSMGFQNTAGPEGHQAVALRVQSDNSIFYNCRMDGYQDTLYAQTHRQFYRNCVISGTVDFIFGDGTIVIQNSLIIVRKPMDNQQNTITAQGKKDRRETTGIVIHNCRIVPEEKLFPMRFQIKTFLGRPWKEFSTAVLMECGIGDLVQPLGWMPWAGNFALDTLYFAEYNNRGPGANVNRRVPWKGYHVITNRNDALKFTVGNFLQGMTWLPRENAAPFLIGLKG